MIRRLKMASALALLLIPLGNGLARAQGTYQPPPPYQPPNYAPAPYTPQPGVQQQALPPPAATQSAQAPTAELPLGAPTPQAPPAAPPSSQDEATAIRNAIDGWADNFNARKSDAVCDAFAADLQYDFGVQPGNYNTLCQRLKQSLGESAVQYRYTPDIREILISGDLAVVRLVWTLNVARNGNSAPTVITEPAMYVMRHQQDGRWQVFRFLAFDVSKPQQQ